jgi:hypothetical protein
MGLESLLTAKQTGSEMLRQRAAILGSLFGADPNHVIARLRQAGAIRNKFVHGESIQDFSEKTVASWGKRTNPLDAGLQILRLAVIVELVDDMDKVSRIRLLDAAALTPTARNHAQHWATGIFKQLGVDALQLVLP